MTRRIRLDLDDGSSLPALHVAATGPTPAPARPMLLIHESFGINQALQATAARWASLGFEVLCPDLFSRMPAAAELEVDRPGDMETSLERLMRLDRDLALQDLGVAAKWLQSHCRDPRVVVLGHCFGGRLAVRVALEMPVAAAVCYYGLGLEGLLPESPQPIAPCLLHLAGKDRMTTPRARQEVLARAGGATGITAHVYPDSPHGFARSGSRTYDAAADRLAEARTLEWLA